MKSIMISIKPKWVAKILNGEKTIEIRNTCPSLFKGWGKNDSLKYNCGFDVYIYCTKEEELFYNIVSGKRHYFTAKNRKIKRLSNGMVIAKFTLNKVEEIINKCVSWDTFEGGNEVFEKSTQSLSEKELQKLSCLSCDDLDDYLGWCKEGKVGYAWHISNLVIFDKSKELSEFKQEKRVDCYNADFDYHTIEYREYRLTKAPQSWCYIESEEQ